MSTVPRPPHRLPVLTEVVPTEREPGSLPGEVPDAPLPPLAASSPPTFAPTVPAGLPTTPVPVAPTVRPAVAAAVAAAAAAAGRPVAPLAPLNEEAVVQRVLADVQRQLDLVFEYRLREMLTPALARIADSLIRDTRNELATTLRDIVTRAVAQELQRQRGR